ncbi:hypothetical protein WICMUC_004128 [Wickerhamomyces mucosus]|uniref:HDA1 complex subunit 3 n=1 Tax=Wickerhamomyces mucosus TaxID=1378264 RepID=A0A9P8PII9_9ASCO|nr:hypothetical protein WICMUC_004128 [Wickerhamomyces mucosus]
MDLFKILDTTPEPPIVNVHHSQNVSGDYWLPCPMSEYQKELTDQVISLHYSDILKYFETDDKDIVLLDSLEVLYLNSQLVATHPYMLVKHYLPKNLTAKDTPLNLAETSGKFQVLKDIISLIDDKSLNVAVVGRSGYRLLDLIESLLLSCRTNIKRHYGNYIKDPSKIKTKDLKELTCHIIPSDISGFKIDETFDLVFSFDITSQNEFLRSLKKTPKTPILRFVSTNSIDHIALYFRKEYNTELKTQDYLVDVTAATVVLRDRVGTLPPDLRPIYSKNLSYLKNWFQDFTSTPWPLPDVSPIKKYNSADVENSLLSEVHYEKKTAAKTRSTFYETKRLNQEYTSNPLKDINFGILSTNSNYQDSLTHKLLQNYNVLLKTLEISSEELKNIEQFKLLDEDFLLSDESKIIGEIDHIKSRIISANINSEKISPKIEILKHELENLKVEIGNFGSSSLFKINVLKKSINSLENKEQNLNEEIDYMKKEIQNAKNSIKESEESATKLYDEVKTNNQKLSSYFCQSDEDEDTSSQEIQRLISEKNQLNSAIHDNLRKLANYRSRTDNRRNSPSVK